MRISFAAPALALVLMAGVIDARQAAITQYPLPAEVTYPEGIAYDAKAGAVYTGSAATGNVVRVTLGSKQGTIVAANGAVLPAEPFPALLGMELDGSGRLWIAGGRTGKMAVIDAAKGTVLKRFDTPAEPGGLINDVAIAGGHAYFTDTLRPTLWRVSTKGSGIGEVEPWLSFTGSPLEYGQGANLNGITATPDGKHLIVVHMSKGLLYKIGVDDKRITPIETGGEALNTADGLVLDGRTLYVVRQGEQEIATVALSADLNSGKVVSRFKNPALLWPATAVKVGDQLLVVSTQFNKRNTKDPVTPFSLVGVPLSLLSGK
jgi:Cu-Zn family superoxide dismutase